MTLKKALLGATVLAALPVFAQAQTSTTRPRTTAPAAAPAPAPMAAPVMTPAPVYVAPRTNLISGLYISGALGANWMSNPSSNGLSADMKTGWVGLGAIGWGFGNGLRAEVEGNYRSNEINGWNTSAQVSKGGGGTIQSYGVMVNALYDFDIGSAFVPYLGAGVGWAQTELSGARRQANNPANGAATGYYGNDVDATNFAYQAIIGAAYNFGGGLYATLEYRYYGVTGTQYGISRTNSAPQIQSNVANVPHFWSPSNNNNSLLLGFRYAFNQPAPPPVPVAVAPAAARTYLVFFDWDKYNLTDRARQIIAEAAQTARSTGTTRIEVAGHADRSGTPQYNQALSQRRADAVAAELVRRGVNRNEIAISAYGESRPLVPTADGVREPQNRRVEIVLR